MLKESRHVYTTASGNRARVAIYDAGGRVGCSVLWGQKPIQADFEEVNAYITHDLLQLAPDEMPTGYANIEGPGAAMRSLDQVARFLESGDPGVPTKKFDK